MNVVKLGLSSSVGLRMRVSWVAAQRDKQVK